MPQTTELSAKRLNDCDVLVEDESYCTGQFETLEDAHAFFLAESARMRSIADLLLQELLAAGTPPGVQSPHTVFTAEDGLSHTLLYGETHERVYCSGCTRSPIELPYDS